MPEGDGPGEGQEEPAPAPALQRLSELVRRVNSSTDTAEVLELWGTVLDDLARDPLSCADRLDCLPPRGPVRVIAAGVGGDLPALGAIHAAIEEACHPLGFRREQRSFRPHVTLARAKPFGPKWPRESLNEGLSWRGPAC